MRFKLLAALISGCTVGGLMTWQFASARSAPLVSELPDVVQASTSWRGRGFYLSKARVSGGAATSACSVGFHMSSIYEVLNVSALRYETTMGLTSEDSGQG